MYEDKIGKIISKGLVAVLKDNFDTEFYKGNRIKSSLGDDKFQVEWCLFMMCLMVFAVWSEYGQNELSSAILNSFHEDCLETLQEDLNTSEDLGDLLKDRYSSYIRSYNNKTEPGHIYWLSKTICKYLGLDDEDIGSDEDIGNILPMAKYFSDGLVENKIFVEKVKLSSIH